MYNVIQTSVCLSVRLPASVHQFKIHGYMFNLVMSKYEMHFLCWFKYIDKFVFVFLYISVSQL